MLDLDQCVFMLSIRNPYFKQAIGHQRHAINGNEQPGIFQEQAAADLPRHRGTRCFWFNRCRVIGHSITSSARARSVGAISRPIALAALRLMTSSNVVGCWTGKSAGLAPLRILPAYTP